MMPGTNVPITSARPATAAPNAIQVNAPFNVLGSCMGFSSLRRGLFTQHTKRFFFGGKAFAELCQLGIDRRDRSCNALIDFGVDLIERHFVTRHFIYPRKGRTADPLVITMRLYQSPSVGSSFLSSTSQIRKP